MARQLVEKYVFAPGVAGTGTLKFPGKCDLTQLLIVQNKTKQVNMYAMGDPTKNGSVTYNATDNTTFYSEQTGVTTLTFAADTSTYSSSDKIAIYTDAPKNVGNIVRPYAFGVDAIERQRVSSPQSLIDADFEYGLQPTKWANYSDIRNIPGIYERPGLDLFVTSVVTDGATPSLITITTSVAHGLSVGNPIIVYGLAGTNTASRAEGSFVINTVPTTTTLTYYAKGTVGTASQTISNPSTYARKAGFYTGAGVPVASITSNAASPSVITVTTSAAHGLVPGSPIVAVATSAGTNHGLITGDYFAETVPSNTTFTFTARTGGAVANSAITANIYARSDAFVLHRPFDGGVQLGNFNPCFGASISRQTKKYMRYQSGKGLLWTSGVLFNPVLNLDQISSSGTAAGSTITVTTEIDHGLQAGATVVISGVVTSGYNGTYAVTSVTSETTFTVTAGVSGVGATSAVITQFPRVVCTNWAGATVRCGPFDEQNGVFWEYDGKELAVVKRSSTYQISGTVAVTSNSQAVVGTSCRFTQQLKVNDNIVIRGMTYKVNSITDDNTLTINPAYRGLSNSSGVKVVLTSDVRVPQSQFNFDKLDGTGFSGFNVALNKMQMMGISFSWYGAGFIDFMMRGSDGNMVLAHRMKNNNVNDEAYMRTGNSSVRYQVKNESAISTLSADIASGSTTIPLVDASRFPTAGTVLCEGELISYTGVSGNTLTGCTRNATLSFFAAGSTRNFTGAAAASHAAGVNQQNSVMLVSVTASPTIAHWGSSYIMDGGFDNDRGYYFNYNPGTIALTAGQSKTVFFLRLAPAVSNSISGTLGDRDLINRSLLLLQKLQTQSDQSVTIYGILNPSNISAYTDLTWTSVNTVALGSQPSFSQVSTTVTTVANPGEQIFGSLGPPGGLNEIDLSNLKELSNSSIGGYNTYPDGPDVLAVVVKNNNATTAANVNINLFWSEAQA